MEHWIAIVRNKPNGEVITYESFSDRLKATEQLSVQYQLTKKQSDLLSHRLYLKIPRSYFIEVQVCSCDDGKHSEEL